VEELIFGKTLRNQNSIQEENSRLISGNVCYHSVQKLLSFSLLPKNLKITVYKTIISHVVLYGCETLSLTLRDVRRLRVFDNRVLGTFGLKRDEVTREWRKQHNEELNNLYSPPNIFLVIKSRRVRWARHVAGIGRGEAYTEFGWET